MANLGQERNPLTINQRQQHSVKTLPSALAGRESRWLAKNRVGVERVYFPQNNEKLGDRKCLGKSRKSFVGHPNAILFWRISQLGVFQQQLAISLIDDMDKVS